MPNAAKFLQLVDRLAEMPVLCVGDAVLDRFIHGSVSRISPEAPIPILRVDRETAMLGGAGNVVNNIAGLGGVAGFIGIIGEDEAGALLTGLMAKVCATAGLVVEAERPTTVKTRFVSGSQQLLRVDQEVVRTAAPATEQAMLTALETALPRARAVVISDYAKGAISPLLAERVIAAARRQGIPVVVDSKMTSYACYRGATVLKPNRRELSRTSGLPVGADDEIVAASLRLIELTGVEAVVATRSEQGMSVVMANGEAVHLHTEAKEVFDVSGAGDTVAATLALALAAGASLVEAAELANHAAGIVVGKTGTATVRLSELKAALAEQKVKSAHKIKSLDDTLDEIERWRARGLRVGFTNGCFDILHPGHISLIAEARSACDRLIVGLNSDESTRRLKGPTRPVNNQEARARVLAALEDVDGVVVFGEDTPGALIETLRPDVLIKGADYALSEVVGAEFVMSYGGQVVLAEIQEGHSTTATIQRMRV